MPSGNRSELGDSSSLVGPRVFISYAHDTEQHKAQVRRFCVLLRKCGIDARMDAYDNDRRRDWYAWMIDHVNQADYTIVIASPDYAGAGDGAAPTHRSRGVQSESALLRDLYHSDRATWVLRILPVILPGSSLDGVPQFLQPHCADHYRIDELTQASIEDLLRILTGQAPYLLPKLGDVPALSPRDELSPSTETVAAPENKIATTVTNDVDTNGHPNSTNPNSPPPATSEPTAADDAPAVIETRAHGSTITMTAITSDSGRVYQAGRDQHITEA